MVAALFYLIPLAMAGAMAWWLHRTRKTGGQRWIAYWFAALTPMALLASLHGLGLVTYGLANLLIVPAVLGVAAFAGGAIYLVLPTLLGLLAWLFQAFRESMKTPKSTSRSQDDCCSDEDSYWQQHTDAMRGYYRPGNFHLYGEYDEK